MISVWQVVARGLEVEAHIALGDHVQAIQYACARSLCQLGALEMGCVKGEARLTLGTVVGH